MAIWRQPICALALAMSAGTGLAAQPNNVVLFVPDGLRSALVDETTAPAMNQIKTEGVFFANSHSIYPTFTTANASAFATGHALGDTGDFSNTIFTSIPEAFANGTVTPFLENDQVLSDIDEHFPRTGADGVELGYLDEETVMAAARAAGYATASVGKLGPVAIQDHENSALVDAQHRDTRGGGIGTIFIDDKTGSPAGIPVDAGVASALAAVGVATTAPGRGANGNSGTNATPGTTIPNNIQQDYFVEIVSDVILPRFKAAGKPFMLVFWSRDPDGTQHNHGDGPNALVPGINGPAALAGVANADSDLSRIRQALDRLGLSASTDILVSADHGFSTISKNSGPDNSPSKTSYAATETYQAYRGTPAALQQEVNTGFLPSGFLAIDLAHGLNLPLHDPDSAPATAAQPVTPAAYPPVDPTEPPTADGTRRQRPVSGNGIIGDVDKPALVVAANGGSDLIYLPDPATAQALARQVVDLLLGEDYVSGIFVDDALGSVPGTLPLSAVNLKGKAATPTPAIVVNFKAGSTLSAGCVFKLPELCATEIADSPLQQGQGMHGSLGRADTHNFMAAIGPDFKKRFVDPAPTSNADIAMTMAKLLGLDLPHNGTLIGRPLGEALVGGTVPAFKAAKTASARAGNGLQTEIETQSVGGETYIDMARFVGGRR